MPTSTHDLSSGFAMRFWGFFSGLLLGFGAIFGGVYRGSFRIDFLGFKSYFSMCVFIFLVFSGYFQWGFGYFIVLILWFFRWVSMWLHWGSSLGRIWFTHNSHNFYPLNLPIQHLIYLLKYSQHKVIYHHFFFHSSKKKKKNTIILWHGDL